MSGVGLFRYIAIMESATISLGRSGQKFGRRIGIGLTNDNATDKLRRDSRLGIFLYNMDYNVMYA